MEVDPYLIEIQILCTMQDVIRLLSTLEFITVFLVISTYQFYFKYTEKKSCKLLLF